MAEFGNAMKYTVTFQGQYKVCFFFVPLGKFGPPKLGIRKKEDQIIVDIFHPLITTNGNVPAVVDDDDDNNCYTFTYKVFVRINRSEVCLSISSFKTENFLGLA